MRKVIFFAATTLFFSEARAAPIEVWLCRNRFGFSEAILAVAAVNEGRTTGSISVAGIIHNTKYQVAGFDRRWDFGPRKDGTYDYTFIISPDGSGSYYYFGSAKTAKPSIFMQCVVTTQNEK